MEFQSFNFLVFFIIVLIFVRLIFSNKPTAKKQFLLAVSYYFYMSWDWRFGFLILGITCLNYFLGDKIASIQSKAQKTMIIKFAVAVNLAVLGYFKYTNFFIDSANDLISMLGFSSHLSIVSIILPLGVSFYTFHSMGYVIDIYREKIKPADNFIDYALFVSFFPHLVAGPIMRASFFLPQLKIDYQEPFANPIDSGLSLIIRGLLKKVIIADVLGVHIVDPAFSSPSSLSPLFLLIALYAYSYQVYMDFSGYTDIARGVSRSLGYELQVNFRRPYKAISISDFWQRWHISMSSFFREYLYFSLGGSKKGNVYINLFVTFVLIGAWHGAGWTFILYGSCHGLMMCFERWHGHRKQLKGMPEKKLTGLSLAWQVFLIFNLVSFTRLLFRSPSMDVFADYLQSMLTSNHGALPLDWIGMSALIVATVSHYTPDKLTADWTDTYCRLPSYAQAAIIVTSLYLVIVFSVDSAPFIYFQF